MASCFVSQVSARLELTNSKNGDKHAFELRGACVVLLARSDPD
jgi:hypothetical protein